jgi:hypothetical protein
MATFKIEWTEELWCRAYVEAETREEAREFFWSGEFDASDPSYVDGTEIQDDIEIEEVE